MRKWLYVACTLVVAIALSRCGESATKSSDTATTTDTASAEVDTATIQKAALSAVLDGPVGSVGPNNLLPIDVTSATVALSFTQDVSGVLAGSTVVVSGDGAPTVSVTGGPRDYTLTVDGLVPNGTYVVRVEPGEGEVGIETTSGGVRLGAPVEVTFAVDGWTLREAFTAGSAAALRGPFFVDVTEGSGLETAPPSHGRVALVDFDNDGLEDLVTWPVSTDVKPAFLKRTWVDGAPRFEDVTAKTGLQGVEANILAFGDVDNDGDQDLFTGISARAPLSRVGVWLNDGTGAFTFVTSNDFGDPQVALFGADAFLKEMAALSFADFDGDGNLDLYIGTHRSTSPTTDGSLNAPDDELFMGDGAGGFTRATLPDQVNPLTVQSNASLSDARRVTYGACPADYDGDGDVDLFVNNYGAGRPALGSAPTYVDHNLLWNNAGGVFTDVGVAAGVAATVRGIGGVEEETPVVLNNVTFPGPIGGNGFGCSWGDVDSDGDLDLVVGSIAHPDYAQSDRTMLHINQGPPDFVFTEESAAHGLEYYEDELHPFLIDADNDGRLDLAVSRLRGGSKFEFYPQYASGKFVRQPHNLTGVDIARPGPTLWFDFDDDGDLDFYMARDSSVGTLFRNDVARTNGFIVLRLEASAPRDATGARVTLTSSVGSQVREVTSGTGHYNTQQSRDLVFGLGGDNGATDVTIRWPNGETQVLGAIKANVRLRVVQGGAITRL